MSKTYPYTCNGKKYGPHVIASEADEGTRGECKACQRTRIRTRRGTPIDQPVQHQFRGLSAFEKILLRIEIDAATGCWIWPGRTCQGYGLIGNNGKTPEDTTHVVMALHFLGEEERDRWVDPDTGKFWSAVVVHHKRNCDGDGGVTCSSKACCNPDHLRVMSNAEHRRLRNPDGSPHDTHSGVKFGKFNPGYKEVCKRGHNLHGPGAELYGPACAYCRRIATAAKNARRLYADRPHLVEAKVAEYVAAAEQREAARYAAALERDLLKVA